MFDSVFGKSFNAGKCKTLLKLAMSRIKLLRNKRDIQLKQMKRELAQLLQTNQEQSARIRVEHVYREQNIMAAYDIIELFCELIVVRLPIIESQRQCPVDLREAISSLVFAAPRCADLPELQQIRTLFAVKYGKEFAAGAAELRPDCGVNRLIIEKLSVRAPSGEMKLKLMKEIAAEQSMEWDPTQSESELLKAPEDLLEGSSRFLGASQMPLRTPSEVTKLKELAAEQRQAEYAAESNARMVKDPDVSMFQSEKQYIPFVMPVPGDTVSQGGGQSPFPYMKMPSQKGIDNTNLKIEEITDASIQSGLHQRPGAQRISSSSSKRFVEYVSERDENFKNVAAAAHAAAQSAERAVAAARAAASLANGSNGKDYKSTSESSSDSDADDFKRVQQSDRAPSESYFKIHAQSFNEQLGGEKPLFDEDVEKTSSGRAQRSLTKKQLSWKEIPDQSNSFSARSHTKYDDEFDQQEDDVLPVHEKYPWQEDHRLSSKKWQSQKSESMKTIHSEPQGEIPHFDDTDSQPPQRPPPNLPGDDHIGSLKPSHIHPKLPDYEDLTARFGSLRSKRP